MISYPESTETTRRSRFIVPILIFLYTLILISIPSLYGIDFHHDGLILKSVRDQLEGQIPYRDFFSQYNLLALWIQELFFYVGQQDYLAVKLGTASVYALTSLFIYGINLRLLPRRFAIGSSLVWPLLGPYFIWSLLPWSSVYALCFQMAATYVLCGAVTLSHPRGNKLILLGLLTSFTFWTRQTVGVALFGAEILILFLVPMWTTNEKMRASLLVAVWTICSSLPFFFYLAYHDALSDWFTQNFLTAVKFTSVVSDEWYQEPKLYSLIKALLARDQSNLWRVFPASAGFIILILSFKKIFRKEQINTSALTLAIVTVAGWHQYYPISCYRHVFWATSYALILPVFLIWHWSFFKSHFSRVAALAVCFTLLVVPEIQFRIGSFYKRLQIENNRIDQDLLAGLRSNSDQKREIDDLIAEKDRLELLFGHLPVLNIGNNAFFSSVWTNMKNPVPLHVNFDIGKFDYEAYDAKVEKIARTQNLFLVSSGDIRLDWGYQPVHIFPSGQIISMEKDMTGPLAMPLANHFPIDQSQFHLLVLRLPEYNFDSPQHFVPGYSLTELNENFTLHAFFNNAGQPQKKGSVFELKSQTQNFSLAYHFQGRSNSRLYITLTFQGKVVEFCSSPLPNGDLTLLLIKKNGKLTCSLNNYSPDELDVSQIRFPKNLRLVAGGGSDRPSRLVFRQLEIKIANDVGKN